MKCNLLWNLPEIRNKSKLSKEYHKTEVFVLIIVLSSYNFINPIYSDFKTFTIDIPKFKFNAREQKVFFLRSQLEVILLRISVRVTAQTDPLFFKVQHGLFICL